MVYKVLLFLMFRSFYLRLVLVVCVWAGILSSASIAFGAQWSVEPVLHSEGQFYDNLTLTPEPHHSAWAMKISPTVGISYATEILNLKASPKYEHARYFSDDPIEETFNNYFFPLSGSYRTEVDRLGLDLTINRDNAFLSELEEAGVATRFIPRNFGNVRGSWDRSFTERMTVKSSYQYTDVSYDRKGDSRLRDYHVHAGTVGADFQWTEELRVHGTVSYANYYVSSERFRSQGPGLELGFSQRLFETFSLSGSGGLRNVRTTLGESGQREKDTTLSWLLNVSLDKEWERSHMAVGYRRTLNPSGLGVLFITDRVDLVVDHQLTHALNVSLQGTFSNNDTVGSSSDARGVDTSRRRYWKVGPAVSWRVTEYWSWNLSYAYAKRKQSGETADSNNVIMGLTYTWQKWAVSR